MPYVPDHARHRLEPAAIPENAGELNYCMTRLATLYLADGGLNYTTLNEIIGAFEAAKLEFYRRVVTPYEERKRSQNGDVYPHI